MHTLTPAEAASHTKKADKRQKTLQNMMAGCAGLLHETGRSLVIVFEGLDASGKSGCIRRLTRELDMKQYRVHPTSRPTESEYSRHYLWRFWQNLPACGHIAVFDRSWYGRVLVERVENLCRLEEWRRAYHEINAFEKQLFDDGTVIVKLWLDVSEQEQLERFRARMDDPCKAHKLTDEDWRNRAKRFDYDRARDDMLRLTNTGYAPWFTIPADDKKAARIAVPEAVMTWVDLLL